MTDAATLAFMTASKAAMSMKSIAEIKEAPPRISSDSNQSQ